MTQVKTCRRGADPESLLKEYPDLEQMLRMGARYVDIMAQTGITEAALKRVNRHLGYVRKSGRQEMAETQAVERYLADHPGAKYADMDAKFGWKSGTAYKRVASTKYQKRVRSVLQRVGGLSQVKGTPEQRWAQYLRAMAQAWEGGARDITYWVAVAHQVRLYPGIRTVVSLLPRLRADLEVRCQIEIDENGQNAYVI